MFDSVPGHHVLPFRIFWDIHRLILGHRNYKKLADAEILPKRSSGNQVLSQANRDGIIYQELASITRKTFGVADVIHEALQTLMDQVDFSFIYGSVAKEEDRSSSDIGLMVVTDQLSHTDLMNCLTKY